MIKQKITVVALISFTEETLQLLDKNKELIIYS